MRRKLFSAVSATHCTNAAFLINPAEKRDLLLFFFHFAAKCGNILTLSHKISLFFYSIFTFIFYKICIICRLKKIKISDIMLPVYSGHGNIISYYARQYAAHNIRIKSRCRYHRGFFRGSGGCSVKHSAENETANAGSRCGTPTLYRKLPGVSKVQGNSVNSFEVFYKKTSGGIPAAFISCGHLPCR